MSNAIPMKICAGDARIPNVLDLVRCTFAYMETRINPPSSMHQMTIATINEQCSSGEIWSIGEPPHACIFLTKKEDCLYIGKLAVSEKMRGQGIAKQLVQLAEKRAVAKGLSTLELETRIELHENHKVFRRLGFVKFGEGKHEGFSKPTYVVMRKSILPS